MKLPDAIVMQDIAGHLRIKVPTKKNDTEYFNMVEKVFGACNNVKSVKVNPANSSIIIKYTGDFSEISDFAETHHLFQIVEKKPNTTPIMQICEKGVTKTDGLLNFFTFGQLDLRTIAFVFFVGVGIFQLARGNFVLPSWFTAFWYASKLINTEKGRL